MSMRGDVGAASQECFHRMKYEAMKHDLFAIRMSGFEFHDLCPIDVVGYVV